MANADIPFPLTLGKPEMQLWGWSVILKFSVQSIFMKWQPFWFCHNGWHWYSISVDTQKTRNPSFFGGGVSNLKIIHMIDIYKMAAIFLFFHNGWHWYSISIDTRKTGDPNFGGVSNLKSFHRIEIFKRVAILQFFHNGWHYWYSISVNILKTWDPKFGGGESVIWNFFVQWNDSHFFYFFMMADADILFPSTFRKLEMRIFCWFSLPCQPS